MKRAELMTFALLVLLGGCGGAQATPPTLRATAEGCPIASPAVGSVCHPAASGGGARFCSYPGVATPGAHGATTEHVFNCDDRGRWACFDKPAADVPTSNGGATNVAADPDGTRIRARVLSIKKADDGWGAWAQLAIDSALSGASGAVDASLAGRTVTAFVPPPLVETLTASGHFDGTMMIGGPEETYSLVPPPVR